MTVKKIFEGLDFIIVIFDNFLVIAHTPEELLERGKIMTARAAEHNLLNTKNAKDQNR